MNRRIICIVYFMTNKKEGVTYWMFNFKSIKTKLIIIISLVSTILLCTMGISIYEKSNEILYEKFQDSSKQIAINVNHSIKEFLGGMESETKLISNNSVLENLDINNQGSRNNAVELLQNTKNSNESIVSTYIADKNGDRLKYDGNLRNVSGEYDARQRPWYKEAISKKGQVIWTEPYKDVNTSKIMITVARSVEKDGNIIGVAAIDVSLEKLSKDISNIKVGRTGYVCIMNKDGTIISHHDLKQIGKKSDIKKNDWNYIISNNTGYFKENYGITNKLYAYDTNNENSWKIVSIANGDELTYDTAVIRKFILFSAIVGIIISVIISILIGNFAHGILKKLKSMVEEIGDGNFSISIPEELLNRKDEFGRIAKYVDNMKANVKGLVLEVKKNSINIEERSENLNAVSEEMSSSSQEVSAAVQGVAKSAENEQHYVDNMIGLLNDISENMKNMKEKLSLANASSDEATSMVKSGKDEINSLKEAINNVKASFEVVLNKVNKLTMSIEQISDINNVIAEISNQTNLLALNAAIEAQRAGESGKGFSVVSQEIGKLADESEDSAKKIKALINSINNDSKEVMENSIKAKSKVDEQNSVVENAIKSFDIIVNSIEKVTPLINQTYLWANNTEESRNKFIDTMNKFGGLIENTTASTEEIAASSEEVSASTQEVASAAENLNSTAKKLVNAVGKFKVE